MKKIIITLFILAFTLNTTNTIWAEYTPTGTIDIDNTSTWDNNLIDNNYANLIYNNSSQWTVNKSLPAVDLGSSLPVWIVRIYWWNPATYGVTNAKIQWSTNGTTWVDLFSWISKTTGATWDFNDYTVIGNYRYYRFYSITGLNTNWFVISELEVFAAWGTSTEYINIFNRNMEIKNNTGKVEICNNEAVNRTIEINSLQ